jgi:hypothetical protein
MLKALREECKDLATLILPGELESNGSPYLSVIIGENTFNLLPFMCFEEAEAFDKLRNALNKEIFPEIQPDKPSNMNKNRYFWTAIQFLTQTIQLEGLAPKRDE